MPYSAVFSFERGGRMEVRGEGATPVRPGLWSQNGHLPFLYFEVFTLPVEIQGQLPLVFTLLTTQLAFTLTHIHSSLSLSLCLPRSLFLNSLFIHCVCASRWVGRTAVPVTLHPFSLSHSLLLPLSLPFSLPWLLSWRFSPKGASKLAVLFSVGVHTGILWPALRWTRNKPHQRRGKSAHLAPDGVPRKRTLTSSPPLSNFGTLVELMVWVCFPKWVFRSCVYVISSGKAYIMCLNKLG